MNKMALFVEGRTEQIFAVKLIREIASANSVEIKSVRIRGGTTCPRETQTIETDSADGASQHFILIYDCGGDSAVKKRMLEEYGYLAKAGYSKIICVRDVRSDFRHDEIERLQRGLLLGVEIKPIAVSWVLSVMEIESWFLSEHTHFPRIDPAITTMAISQTLGFDPSKDDMRCQQEPAKDLDDCYHIAGKAYSKSKVARTVNALDMDRVYRELVERLPYLRTLCDEITDFLGDGGITNA